jgi:hypothetical protein
MKIVNGRKGERDNERKGEAEQGSLQMTHDGRCSLEFPSPESLFLNRWRPGVVKEKAPI